MAPVFSPWMRRKVAASARPAKRRPLRQYTAPRLVLENLEDRTLLSWMLSDVLNAYNTGARALAQVDAVSQALGLHVPLVNETLTSSLGLVRDFQTPFQTQPGGTDWTSVVGTLQNAGFSIQSPDPMMPFPGTPDANGDLLKVTWSRQFTPTALFTASGKTGFDYLDSATGSLLGAFSAQQATVTIQVTLGIDVQNNQPAFYVADSSSLHVGSFTVSTGNPLSGNLSIGALGNVDASASASLTVNSAALTLNNVHNDHKLRAADFSNLGTTVSGNIQGSVHLAGHFVAHLTLLGDVPWDPSFDGTINNGWQQGSVNLNPPSPQSVLNGLAHSFFSLGGGFPILGQLQSDLNRPLPLINQSIGQLTGLSAKLPALPSLPSINAGSYSIPLGPGTLNINATPQTIDALLHGQTTDLVSWTTGPKSISLADLNVTLPIFSLGVPGIVSAEIDALFGLHAALTYDVGFGIDTNGFWIKAGSQSDPTLGLTFGVTAGLQGQVEVFGFPIAKAGGNIGFSITPYVALSAPPYSANPGRVYLNDLSVFGANPITDVLSALSAGIKGDFTGGVFASIDLFLFSISWHWGVDIPVFNYVHNPTWPAAGHNGAGGSDPYPSGPDANGVLTFNGTANADNVQLKQTGPGTVQLTWAGHGPTHTYSGVQKVVFHGMGGDDRLSTAPGFMIPIQADAPSGNAFLQGGDAGNTLTGGSGNDTLIGGKGNDSITGGSGNNMIIGGDGSDTLRAGTGTDQIFAGAGNSSLFGGPGDDSLYAGGGRDTIHGGSGVYLIDGGSGNDVIYGDAGHAAKMINGTLTYPVIHAGTGNTVVTGPTSPAQIYGDGGSDTITGGPGNDTIYAGTGGGNVIHGGGGNDMIFGGTGNDSLYADTGNCTIYGGAGSEFLYGGDGQNLQVNGTGTGLINAAGDGMSHGSSLLIAGPGNDVLYGDSTGHSTLHAGAGHDTLFAGSGGDYLAAGTGVAALYGGPGDDSLQIEFTPTGQSPDTVAGGPGNDTLVLKGTAQDNKITFTQVAGTTNQYHATLNDLDSGTSLGQVTFTMPPDVEQVALEGGPGNNVIQVDPSVTRDMFVYGGPGNNTIYGGSGNDTLVGGPGSSVIYGGSGDSLLYGGDMPTQDQPPMLDSSGTLTRRSFTPGHNTLIAGSGNDELFAGPAGDVLIGGSAILQNGQYVLVPGAGRDVLEGGGGSDLLIAGPGSLGELLYAGTGSSILVSANTGTNSLDAGNSTGNNLLLGSNLGNNLRGGAGHDTLVGGLGLDYIQAGSGNQTLSADPSAAYWTQAQTVAATHHVVLGAQPNPLQGDAIDLFDKLNEKIGKVGDQISTLEHLKESQGLTPAQESQLEELLNEHQLLLAEGIDVDHILGATALVDSLVAGAGTDQLYGGAAATWMAGDTVAGSSGNDTFYNYNSQDTIQGGHGTNTLMFVGDGTINLTHVTPNGQDGVNVAINGQQWLVGNIGHISGIQILAVQLLNGNDTVTVNFGSWAGLQLYVAGGAGTNVIDASAVHAQETLLGGTGNDTIRIATQLATGSLIQPGSAYNELDVQVETTGDTVRVAAGVLTADGVRQSTAGFQKLVVIGGPGTNTFITDGSIANVVLQGGGGGTNTFTVTGGTATLVGGNAANNSFNVTGPGNYTIIGGMPAGTPAPLVASGVSAPAPTGMSPTTAGLSQARYALAVTTVGTKAIFAGGEDDVYPYRYYSNAVDIYDASTGAWSSTTLRGGARKYLVAATAGTKAIFAGGDGPNCGPCNTVDIYDASTGTWSTTTLPGGAPRDDMVATTVGTKAFFAGGRDASGGYSNTVAIYDASTSMWSTTTLPSGGRELLAATTVGTKALFAGGTNGFGYSSAVDIYDTSTGTWATATLPRGRDFLVATAVGTKALFAAGVYADGPNLVTSNEVDIYDTSTGTWSTTTLPSGGRWALTATAVGTKALFAGGVDQNGSTSDTVEIYDASTGQWSTTILPGGARDYLVATAVGTKALVAGGLGYDTSNAVDIFTFPPAVTVTSTPSSVNGAATIGYKLFDNDAHASSIQVQYSVNGGMWQNATPGPGGDGTSNLASNLQGTAHTFVWNTAHDLGSTNNPSVQVRITPMDSIGTGVTQASGSFAVDNAGVVNALTIAFSDGNNDTVHLIQNGPTIAISGTLTGTAMNLTSLTVLGGTGRNLLDASGMIMPVTLNGGNGSGADTLIGGVGSDVLYYSGNGSAYDGGGGANNVIIYPANNGDNIIVLAPELVVNGVAHNLGSISRIENVVVSGSPARVNNSQQLIWPIDGTPLTNTALSLTAATNLAVTVLTLGFTDSNIRASTGTESAVIDWGGATTSTGAITSGGGGRFTITASHSYPTNSTRPVVVTIVDSLGAATTVGTSFTGGLELEANGDLRNYAGSNFTLPDTGARSFLFRSADVTVFTLHTDGSLYAIPGSSAKQLIDGGVQAMFLGLDNTLYDMHGGGTLYTVASGSIQLHIADNNVQTVTQDKNGDLYKLHTDGSLFALTPTSNWGQVAPNVKSIALTPDSSAVYVLKTDGTFWQLNGTTLTFLAGPTLNLYYPEPVIAGSPNIGLTVTVTDHYGNMVTGYRGTVHFTNTDGQATPLADYTFTAADNSTHIFTLVLKTAGRQSITVHDVSGISSDVTHVVTVLPANATLLVLNGFPSAITAGMANSVTVTAFDAYGNVATGYTGTVHFTSSDSQAALPANYTFTAADNGVHTFMNVILKTAASQSITATDTATAPITGTQAGIIVGPAAASTLAVAGFPSPATAGVPGTLTVTARDAYGNLATGYTGIVHFTSSDLQAVLPPNYTFTVADMGVHTFSVTFRTPGTQSVTATDTGTASITGTQAGIVVNQSAATTLVVGGFPTPITAGVAGTITVVAKDAYGITVAGYRGTVHFTSSAAQAMLPMDYTFTATDAGVHTFTVTLFTAGTQSITVTDGGMPPLSGAQTGITVVAGAASTLRVNGFPASITAGVAGNLTVTAFDAYGNVATGYTGTVHFTSSAAQAMLPMDYTFTATDAGVHTFSITLKSAGIQSLTAADTQTMSITGTQSGIVVNPAAVSRLVVAGFPSPVAAGTAGMITVTALDAYGNVATGYTGTVQFTSSDSRATLPPNYTFTTADAGVHTFSATLGTVGTQTLTATDTANGLLTATQGGIMVNPGPTHVFVVAGFPSPTQAGSIQVFTVTARDTYGNLTPGYTGTVHFTSSDGQAQLPGDYTFQASDNGMHVFGAALKTAGTQSITATDTGDSSITGSQTGIVVTPAAASQFRVSAPARRHAGRAFTLTVAALDPYGNVATGYTGTITFSSSDPLAVLPPDYTFQPADQGMVTFGRGATLITPDDQQITVTDTVHGFSGSATVTVVSGAVSDLPAGRRHGGLERATPTAPVPPSFTAAAVEWQEAHAISAAWPGRGASARTRSEAVAGLDQLFAEWESGRFGLAGWKEV